MKKFKKFGPCLNCGHVLNEHENYCAACGQENRDNNVSFSTLIGEFLNNYFALDSKIFRSFKPFLINPGFLTAQYILGKRETYIHPLRLYLVISLFYFFVLSIILTSEIEEKPLQYNPEVKEATERAKDLSRKELRQNASRLDSLKQTEYLSDSDTTPIRTNVSLGATNFVFGVREVELARNRNISDEALMDSLNIREKTPFKTFFFQQGRKVVAGELKPFFVYAIKNFPIMMFLILPVFALILKTLFWTTRKFYVAHIVHALHLHAFAYLFYGISFILLYNFFPYEVLYWLAFFLVSVYTYISFLKVYQQGKWKTFFKFLLTGMIYVICLSVFGVFEVFVSFFLF